MKIVADENIPLLDAFFGSLGSVVALPGRSIKQSDLKDADVLLVRSITKVDAALLQNTPIKFVGTCTIGTDHLDTDYLETKNIPYANAPGCNAVAVMNYVISALVTLGESKNQDWRKFSVGIVGVGNVGGTLLNALKAIGVNVVGYDPYKEEFASEAQKKQVWQQDVVSLHTPITTDGEHPTHHLVSESTLEQMKPDACLINSCRGAVVDNQALKQFLTSHPQFRAVMDVWENEPVPDSELMRQCFLATPHIAGYSLDGKLNGTAMIYDVLCEYMGLPKRLKLAQLMSEAPIRKITFSQEAEALYTLNLAIRSMYDVRDDHFRMLPLSNLPDEEKAAEFDRLRKEYPMRRDLVSLNVSVQKAQASDELTALGIKLRQK